MKAYLSVSLLCVLLVLPASAQTGGAASKTASIANPITAGEKSSYDMVKGYVTKSAQAGSDAVFAFKATAEVRSFGQIVGHIADANYMMCSAAAGEKSPGSGDIEKTKTTKADLSSALAESFAYCDRVFAAMTDAEGAKMVKSMMGGDMSKLSILAFNTAHDFEHYGNLVTYMRLNKMVPPSSQGGMGR
jgi:uncharacterized damage-inducible protein DinB